MPGDAPDEDHGRSGAQECRCRCDGRLGVFPEPPIAVDPGEEALNHPSPRLNGKADLAWPALDDLNGNRGRLGDPRPLVAGVGEDLADEGEWPPRCLQDRACTIAVLNVGRVSEQNQSPAIGVDQRMALAAGNLLGPVIATRTAALAGLDALGINDGSRWRGLAPGMFAVDHDQSMVDPLEQAGIAPQAEPAIDRAPGREV